MSDSEDDFASADEGEVEAVAESTPGAGSKKTPSKDVKKEVSQTDGSCKEKQNKTSSFEEIKAQKSSQGDTKSTRKDKKADTKNQHEGHAQGGKSKKGKQKGGKKKSANTENEQKMKSGIVKTDSNTPSSSEESISNSGKRDSVDNKSDTVGKEDIKCKDIKKSQEDTCNKDSSWQSSTPVKETLEATASSDSGLKAEYKGLIEEQATLIKSPSSQSISRPPPDHSETEEAVLDRLAGAAKEKSGWGWGWGSSLLEVASSSVSTFTKEVGEGFHTMIETVESTLNVPNPEELAQAKKTPAEDITGKELETAQNEDSADEGKSPSEGKKADKQLTDISKEESNKSAQTSQEVGESDSASGGDNQASGSWFSSWGVSNISKIVESTSKNLVTSSLDVLETLGKKTFDVINEHDPGLKKARGFLHDRGDKPNLSAVLRDAKEQEEVRVQQEKESEEARKAHFGSLFDDFQGLAHLEALEMLSNQSEKRVNTLLSALPPDSISTIKPTLLKIKGQFEVDEDEEDAEEQEFDLLVTDLLKQLDIGTTPDKLIKTHKSVEESLQECLVTEDMKPDPKDIHRVAISGLAELTSKCIEQFHKAGELILAKKTELPDFVNTSEQLQKLTKVLTSEVSILSTKFTEELNKLESGDEIKVNHLVTNIYLEATNSSSYIQDGFQLLLPVIQQAVIEKSQEPDT